MDRELVPRAPNNIQAIQQSAKPLDIPLGTAAWHQFQKDERPIYAAGDILVGHTQDGDPVGIEDQGHIGVVAKTRSGKGTGLIVPNLVLWPGSVVVIDPKGENAILTARRRGVGSAYAKGMGQRVHILDPFGEVATPSDNFWELKASFNPLDMLSETRPESVDDAARIADSLIDSDSSSADPFWNESAQSLIKAVILHMVTCDDFEPVSRNLLTARDLILEGYAELRALLADNLEGGDTPTAYALLFRAMRKNPAFHGEVAKAGERFARMEENSPRMLESVAQVACTNLDFLASAAMQKLVRSSSFSIADLKNDPRGVSIYLCLPGRFMGTHFRLLRIMVTLIIAEMERVRHQPKSGFPVLMVLDEFAALKRMHVIEHAAAQIAGFGVRMMFIVQTLGQLKETYKENWQTLLGNCTTKIFFCNDDPFTRETVSKLIGDVEVVRQTHSQSASHGSSSSHAVGETLGESSNHTVGSSASWSSGPQGGSFSGSVSSSTSRGQSSSQSLTSTYGGNQSATQGMNETIQKRPLITPDEVGRFFGNLHQPMSLILLSGEYPLPLKRLPYYRIKGMRGHFDPHPDHAPPHTLKALPQIIQHENEARLRRRREQARLAQQQAEAKERARMKAEAEEQRRRAETERRDREFRELQSREQERISRRYHLQEDIFSFAVRSGTCLVPIPILGFFYGGIAAIGIAVILWWIAKGGRF